MEFTIYIPQTSDRHQSNAQATAISSKKPQHCPEKFSLPGQTTIANLEILMRLA